jgi:hypothetical protein
MEELMWESFFSAELDLGIMSLTMWDSMAGSKDISSHKYNEVAEYYLLKNP